MLELISLAISVAVSYEIDPRLFCELVKYESNWDRYARSASSVGLCQINQEAWEWWPADPYDPEVNLKKGAAILKWNFSYREGESEATELAVASYVLGHARVDRLLEEHGAEWKEELAGPVRKYVEGIAGKAFVIVVPGREAVAM